MIGKRKHVKGFTQGALSFILPEHKLRDSSFISFSSVFLLHLLVVLWYAFICLPFYSLTLAYTCLKHQTKHSSPLGRCSWRNRSLRHRCVRCKAACAGTWCGRRSGRWCSEPTGCLRYSGCPPLCPSLQNLWDSLSIDRSGGKRWRCVLTIF